MSGNRITHGALLFCRGRTLLLPFVSARLWSENSSLPPASVQCTHTPVFSLEQREVQMSFEWLAALPRCCLRAWLACRQWHTSGVSDSKRPCSSFSSRETLPESRAALRLAWCLPAVARHLRHRFAYLFPGITGCGALLQQHGLHCCRFILCRATMAVPVLEAH